MTSLGGIGQAVAMVKAAALALLALAGCLLLGYWLSGCTHACEVPLDVTLANHPTKPRPAALVLAKCGDDRWQWVCDVAEADSKRVVCDGVIKAVAHARP